jgi:RNA polymerase primary sigma factor
MTSLDQYMKGVTRTSLLSKEEEVTLSQKIEMGDIAARSKMIESNLRLAISIAKKYHRVGNTNLEDLIQESNIGLMKAVDRFDWRKGFKFSTYACWWIKQSVRRFITDHSSDIKIPSHAFSISYKIKKITEEYEEEFGVPPTTEELASLLGVSESLIRTGESAISTQKMLSMDAPVNHDGTSMLFHETIADDESQDIEITMDRERIAKMIKDGMKTLSAREEKILRLRFGVYENFDESQVKEV